LKVNAQEIASRTDMIAATIDCLWQSGEPVFECRGGSLYAGYPSRWRMDEMPIFGKPVWAEVKWTLKPARKTQQICQRGQSVKRSILVNAKGRMVGGIGLGHTCSNPRV
jgi:hypothetical protein